MRLSGRKVRAWSLVALLVLAAVAAYLAASTPPNPSGCRGTAQCFTGTVKEIIDGDTLDVQTAGGTTRIRLALVNSPEVGQPGYQEAKDFTAATCPKNASALVDQDDGQLGGSYGRMVAEVHCGGVNLNEALFESGHAVILTQFCSVSEFASEAWATSCH